MVHLIGKGGLHRSPGPSCTPKVEQTLSCFEILIEKSSISDNLQVMCRFAEVDKVKLPSSIYQITVLYLEENLDAIKASLSPASVQEGKTGCVIGDRYPPASMKASK
ncbi:hypothetical protein EDD22DRAFT_1050174 [Suillus occidentalis]|nr:hypothetical protein EDD22DRAFT_1050174 [Suillus occidentalis]